MTKVRDAIARQRKRRRNLATIAGAVISIASLIWVFQVVESETVLIRVTDISLLHLSLAILLTLCSYIIRSYRWIFFFSERVFSLFESFRCSIMGFFMNNVLPARAGEFVRAHLGGRASGQSRALVLATIAGERLADGLTISILFAVLFSFAAGAQEKLHGQELFYVAYLFAAAAIGITIVMFYRRKFARLLRLFERRFAGKASRYASTRIQRFMKGLEPMFQLKKLAALIPLSILVWVIELAAYYEVARAYDTDLTLGALSLFLAAVNFSSLVPAAPGGVGVIEAFATAALQSIGVEPETAFAMVATQHIIQIVVVGVPGALFFIFGRKDRQELAAALEKEGEAHLEEKAKGEPAETRPTCRYTTIIPCYNEELRLPTTLESVHKYFIGKGATFEILVVDDGSKDGTARVVEEYSRSHPNVRLLQYGENRGKGFAVRFGALRANGELVLFDDADGASPIEEFTKLEAALDDKIDIAIGSRAKHSDDTSVTTVWYRKFIGRVFNTLVNILILPGIKDTQCGFKVFKHDVARYVFQRQRSERFSFDVELLYLARRASFGVAEVPINWTNVPGSKVNLVKDSIQMFIDILRFRVLGILGFYD